MTNVYLLEHYTTVRPITIKKKFNILRQDNIEIQYIIEDHFMQLKPPKDRKSAENICSKCT